MPNNLQIPPTPTILKPKNLVLGAVPRELHGQSQLIAKNAGLALIKPKFFIVDKTRMEEEVSVYDFQHPYGPDGTSIFGTPIFDALVLNQLTYTDFNGNEITLGDFTMEICLFEINLPRNIIRTRVTGRDKDVVEYMGNGNYEIKIWGSLVNKLANIPPADMIRALNQFSKAQSEIAVNSGVLSYFDIYSIVITNAKFKQVPGFRNCFDFELECIDDVPFEIKSNNA